MSDPQYDFDETLASKKQSFDTLKKLRASVKEVRRHVELFLTKVSIYNDRLRTYLREVFALFLAQLQNTTKELVKKHGLGTEKSSDVKFAVLQEIL